MALSSASKSSDDVTAEENEPGRAELCRGANLEAWRLALTTSVWQQVWQGWQVLLCRCFLNRGTHNFALEFPIKICWNHRFWYSNYNQYRNICLSRAGILRPEPQLENVLMPRTVRQLLPHLCSRTSVSFTRTALGILQDDLHHSVWLTR